MGILQLLHAVADYFLSWVKLAQNREVGWKCLDRKTGKYMREQQPLMKKLKLVFLFNPLVEWVDTTHVVRLWAHNKSMRKGRQEATPESHNQIKSFVDFYHINMDDFDPSDTEAYRTFEDFFVRAHRKGSRPIHAEGDPTKAIAVADSRLVVYDTVEESKKIWIKGTDFSITALVMDKQLGPKYANGAVASFRLSPQDYHRYHSPVTGTIKQFRSMPGDYYQVDPIAIRSKVNILTSNARDYVVIETKEFGDVLFVAIGATEVGTVRIHDEWQKPGNHINKGDELGIFQFGGSSIVVAFEPGRIRFDEDLVSVSKHAIMMNVEVGMSLGKAVSKS